MKFEVDYEDTLFRVKAETEFESAFLAKLFASGTLYSQVLPQDGLNVLEVQPLPECVSITTSNSASHPFESELYFT